MADEAGRSRLGRGLASLMGDVGAETKSGRAAAAASAACRSSSCRPNPRNPRRNFAETELDELAASMRERGIIQPIVVRPVRGAPDSYEIIAGERRWRAAQRAGLHEVPIVPLDVSDAEALSSRSSRTCSATTSIRSRRPPAISRSSTSSDTARTRSPRSSARAAAMSPTRCACSSCPTSVQAFIGAGKISAGHARMLIGQPDPEKLAREIVERGLNVRQVEALAQERARASGKSTNAPARAQGRRHGGAGKAPVGCARPGGDDRSPRPGRRAPIRYRGVEQLDDVIRRLETP